ncbi:hypothetical protein H4O18_15145 [Arenibacter sp. BSSL-BM3]|uniref:Glycosyl hydrolase family 32 N-terminal domain-containing protein n=1 Tax=Arenibacter arenosicollis TaxID=2762274 RepID=A0ABR7QQ54_9FLAO|nr:hypothetical protein [Arenibacter arenosicollis]MBC8769332.1 hypothetical protein [Arenibacter arenosicollis]
MDLGNKRELFLDHYLLDTIVNLELLLNTPQEVPSTNIPNGYYQTIIKTDSLYRIYYRDKLDFWKGELYDGNPGEITKSAISRDGYHWQEEATQINDSIKNYIFYEPPFSHNFTPFKDVNPNSEYKYRALSGTNDTDGLFHFFSNDGIKFKKFKNKPVIKHDPNYYEFDSQNIAFWSETENQYVCYFRRLIIGLRSFSRTTSKDFENWSKPINIFPNFEGEHLYTSGIQPYFRAPHIYIGLPTRFFPENGNSTDIVMISSRDGVIFNRTFPEAFIRPGLKTERWGNRSNYITLNLVPLDETHMGIYARNTLYKIRMDGFSSVNSKSKEGFFITKPFRFNGDKLEVNYSTSAGGFIKIEILDENNKPSINGVSYSTEKIIGDEIAGKVIWQNSLDLGPIKDKIIKLRVSMKEADLYSFKFND